MVRQQRNEQAEAAAGNQILPPDPEPWAEPVDGAELLDSIRETFKRHVILPENGDVALALWSVGTYCFDEFRIWPRLLITSPEKRCGKTSLLEALAAVTKRSLPSSNISAAAMFRVTDKLQPTLLIDEADCFLDSSEELAAIVNSGHSRTAAFVLKCDGDSHDVKRFTTWASMAICMIGLPKKTTITDRSIVIQLRRKLANESVERLPVDLVESCEKIRRQAQRWANDFQEKLGAVDPVLPTCANDRCHDNWRPLFAIASLCGGDWPDLARHAFNALNESNNDESVGPLLLNDIRQIFETIDRDRIFSRDLLDLLIENEESPWATWHRGKPISARALCRQLTPYGVRSHGTIRVGGHTSKGYLLSSFQDAFRRYLPEKTVPPPSTPIPNVTPSQVNEDGASSQYLSVTQKINVTDRKPLQPNNGGRCDIVTDKTGREGAKMFFEASPPRFWIASRSCRNPRLPIWLGQFIRTKTTQPKPANVL